MHTIVPKERVGLINLRKAFETMKHDVKTLYKYVNSKS